MENKTKDWEKLSPRVKAYILNCYPCEAYQEIVKGFLGEEGKDTHPKFLDQDTLHHVFNYFTTQDSRAIAKPGHGFEDLRPLEESTQQVQEANTESSRQKIWEFFQNNYPDDWQDRYYTFVGQLLEMGLINLNSDQ